MKSRIALLATLVVIGLTGTSYAAGFALIEQSVKGLGNAYAGGAAVAEDASTIFFNPAGMTRLDGMQVTAGLHYIIPSAKFATTAASAPAALGGGDISTDPTGGDGGVQALVPNFYFSAPAGKNFNYGLSINTPFGLATKYDENWVGRFHGIESDLMTININPSVAYRINSNFSIGFGVSAQYLDANLTQQAVLGAGVQSFTEVAGDSWGYGANFGALYELNDKTRFGVSYRSSVFHSIDGTLHVRLNGATLPVTGKIRLPASAQASVFHQINDSFDIMADMMWTEWSVFEELTFQTPSGPNTTEENWKNNMRYSVGANFRPNETCVLRAGVAFDQTPIPDSTRTPRIPGNDRTWFSLGAGYNTGAWNFDMGYAYLIVKDGSINLIDTTGTRGNLSGTFENGVNIVSVEATYKF